MSDTKTILCTFCGQTMLDTASAYYHKKDCERQFVLGLLELERAQQFPNYQEIAMLEKRLEQASYTGD